MKEGLKLTCGARARLVESREIVGAPTGRRNEKVRARTSNEPIAGDGRVTTTGATSSAREVVFWACASARRWGGGSQGRPAGYGPRRHHRVWGGVFRTSVMSALWREVQAGSANTLASEQEDHQRALEGPGVADTWTGQGVD